MTSNDITVDRAYYVRQLQTYLRTVQRDRTGSSLVPADGIFGSRTTAALREFQQEEGLPVTGVADRTTWDALYRAYLEVEAKNASPTPIQGYQNPSVALTVGDQGDGVAFLQIMLRRLAARYPSLTAENTITGVYSPATARSVSAFQTLSALPPTGEVDKATWNEITALYNAV